MYAQPVHCSRTLNSTRCLLRSCCFCSLSSEALCDVRCDVWCVCVCVLSISPVAITAVSHFVAYETDEMMVDEPGAIAANYRCAARA